MNQFAPHDARGSIAADVREIMALRSQGDTLVKEHEALLKGEAARTYKKRFSRHLALLSLISVIGSLVGAVLIGIFNDGVDWLFLFTYVVVTTSLLFLVGTLDWRRSESRMVSTKVHRFTWDDATMKSLRDQQMAVAQRITSAVRLTYDIILDLEQTPPNIANSKSLGFDAFHQGKQVFVMFDHDANVYKIMGETDDEGDYEPSLRSKPLEDTANTDEDYQELAYTFIRHHGWHEEALSDASVFDFYADVIDLDEVDKVEYWVKQADKYLVWDKTKRNN